MKKMTLTLAGLAERTCCSPRQCSRAGGGAPAGVKLLNVSYDPTRELYQDVNAAFAGTGRARPGRRSTVNQSHGGSGKQARAVIDGLEADVVTLALAYDIDAIADEAGLHRRPTGRSGCPTTARPTRRRSCSWCARATRKGIKDWDDLVKPGVAVITPNPKTSGGARWNYLAAWGYALQAERRRPGQGARSSSRKLYKNVPVLDSGARGSTTTFAQRGIGDVLIAWENEALPAGPASWARTSSRSSRRRSASWPSRRSRVVDKNVDKHGTRAVAEAYLEFLYSPEGQEIARQALLPAARRRPSRKRHAAQFPKLAAVHRRRRVRRLAEGAGDALRRRRRLRSDLPAGIMSGRSRADGDGRRRRAGRACCPGFGLTLGFTLVYLSLHRADPARGAGASSGDARPRASSGGGRRRRARWRPTSSRSARRWSARLSTSCSGCWSRGCWRATAFRARRWSTRWSICRSRCRPRWPASR